MTHDTHWQAVVSDNDDEALTCGESGDEPGETMDHRWGPRRVAWLRRMFDSVGARMAGVILGSIAPISALGTVLIWQDYARLSEASLHRGANLRQEMDLHLRHDIDRTASMLETIGGFDVDGEHMMRFLSLAQAASGLKYCFLAELDGEGRIVSQVSALPRGGTSCAPTPDRVPLHETTASIVVADNRPLLRVMVPLSRDPDRPDTQRRFLVATESLQEAIVPAGAVPAGQGGGLSYDVFKDINVWFVPTRSRLVPVCPQCSSPAPPPDLVGSLAAQAGFASSRSASVMTAGRAWVYGSVAGVGELLISTSQQVPEVRALWVLGLWILTVVGLLGTGLIGVMVAAHRLVVSPLGELTKGVQRWEATGRFEQPVSRSAPREFRTLGTLFRTATHRLAARETELEQAVARQNVLIREIHHRVKNNLQIVASLLNLQSSRIREPAAREEFMLARNRVRALATLHRHLYVEGELENLNMRQFLKELGTQLMQGAGDDIRSRVTLHIDAGDVIFPSRCATPIALIVSETVSNAIKYAFPGSMRGRIAVTLTQVDSIATLIVEDNGIGMSNAQHNDDREGIGSQLIRGFARQIGAKLLVEEAGGTRYTVITTLDDDSDSQG